MPKVSEVYGSGGNYALLNSFRASMECELESVIGGGKNIANFKCIQDGSLRNNGFEYITIVAKDRDGLINDFKALHGALKFGEDPFSERTSTHVHVNVSNMETTHARQMILLYALFEEMFFAMVKPARRDNIHCVPLTETYLPGHYGKDLDGLLHQWHKYTGLNLKRIIDLGTMEFRHMHGTGDAKEMDVWLHVLENLWKLAQRVEVNETTLASKAVVLEWFEAIFFPADRIMMLRPSLFDIIRNSLIDVKMSTIKQ